MKSEASELTALFANKNRLEEAEIAITQLFSTDPNSPDYLLNQQRVESLIEECKTFDKPRALLVEARYFQAIQQWDQAYRNYESILEDRDVSTKPKKEAYSGLVNLILNGYVSTGEPSGIDINDSTEIKPDDTDKIKKQKRHQKQALLFIRAIQAYPYVVRYENPKVDTRFINRVHNMLMGIDNVGIAIWSVEAIQRATQQIDKVAPNVGQLLGRRFWAKVYETYKPEYKNQEEASLAVAEFIINRKNVQPKVLSTWAIQAYEYVHPYRETDGGTQLLHRLHVMLTDSDLMDTLDQFDKYYKNESVESVFLVCFVKTIISPPKSFPNQIFYSYMNSYFYRNDNGIIENMFAKCCYAFGKNEKIIEEEATKIQSPRSLFFSSSNLMRKLHEDYLNDNRHQSYELQHAYDCRFGLVLKK